MITRHLAPRSALLNWAAQHQVELIHESFIRFEVIRGLDIPVTDWIFFSSPAGARLYLENYPIRASHVAALSSGTAEELVRLKCVPGFVGDAAADPAAIGQSFFSKIGPAESVLFPLSEISKKSVSAAADIHPVTEMILYKTLPDPRKLAVEPDLVIFTSPSNVRAFLQDNRLRPDTLIVALGKTTKRELQELGFTQVYLPESTEERALIRLLDGLV